MTKNNWNDVSYEFSSKEIEVTENKNMITSGSLTPILIKSKDGRVIKANLHQPSRSVYPSFS